MGISKRDANARFKEGIRPCKFGSIMPTKRNLKYRNLYPNSVGYKEEIEKQQARDRKAVRSLDVLKRNMRVFRIKRKLTQQELANRSGVHQVTIARYETGNKLPSLETLSRIAAALNITLVTIVKDYKF